MDRVMDRVRDRVRDRDRVRARANPNPNPSQRTELVAQQELEEDAAEAVDVGGGAVGLAVRDLG